MMNFGLIGGGNMATALLEGIIKAGLLEKANLYVYDIQESACQKLKQSFGIHVTGSIEELCGKCDMLLLAIKPHIALRVLEANWSCLENRALISICAGVPLDALIHAAKMNCRILRVMPNTPAMTGHGMSALCKNTTFTQKEQTFAYSLFQSVGRAVWVDESQINAVIGLSGSGPAYGYMMIEAMADGGVEAGLARDLAYELAAQTLLGAASMVLQTKQHPGALKDMVCSPGGTTIAAVHSLEKSGIRNALIEAVCVATAKANDMEKQAKKVKKKTGKD